LAGGVVKKQPVVSPYVKRHGFRRRTCLSYLNVENRLCMVCVWNDRHRPCGSGGRPSGSPNWATGCPKIEPWACADVNADGETPGAWLCALATGARQFIFRLHPQFRPSASTRDVHSAKDFFRVGATGLEPVTPFSERDEATGLAETSAKALAHESKKQPGW